MSHIELTNLSLDYPLTGDASKSVKKALLNMAGKFIKKTTPSHHTQFFYRALDNLSIYLKEGDRVGLIGRNGAGKSTLLRVLSGIYHPTSGTINVNGNISSLLDMSIGLNPEATGYENILLLGILLGKTKKMMAAKFQEIEEFTELGEFLHTPVRTYSNGMRLRLAFAVITSIDPDILLLDEVIGVGDRIFMEKATNRLHQLIHKSNILVISSHDNDIIRKFCNKVIVLESGKCLHYGDIEQGFKIYEESSPIDKK